MTRKPNYEVNEIFTNRQSYKLMSGEEITDEELFTLLEAARWAPSSFNDQPWRFIYAKKGTPEWNLMFNALMDVNKEWVKNASVLITLISRKNYLHNEKENIKHTFDSGAAWENIALQASIKGLSTRAIGGFDKSIAKESLEVPDEYHVEIMIAIGKPNKTKEEIPSERRELKQLVMKGKFKEE